MGRRLALFTDDVSTGGLRLSLVALSLVVASVQPLGAQSSEPERDGFLSHVSAGALISGFEEQFSPYSGQFIARFLTASLPGRGGHDVNVYLYYSTEVWNRTDTGTIHSASLDTSDHAGGAGWQLHMGKVINPAGLGSANATAPDNPLLIMPDGSTRFLYQSSQYAGEMITEDRWRYRFNASIPGWELTTTHGTVYLFQTVLGPVASTMSGVVIAQCTKITDVNGNVITIDYLAPGKPTKITDTYGRTVEFIYTTFDRIQYIRVKNGSMTLQQWEIKYGLSSLLSWTHLIGTRTVYAVRELVPPVGNPWKFTTNSASISKASGAAMLKRIELPTGGIIEYTYKGIHYDVGCQSGIDIERASLWKRTESGRAVTPITYTYAYSNPGKSNATTTITDNLGLGYQETHNLIGFGAFSLTEPNLLRCREQYLELRLRRRVRTARNDRRARIRCRKVVRLPVGRRLPWQREPPGGERLDDVLLLPGRRHTAAKPGRADDCVRVRPRRAPDQSEPWRSVARRVLGLHRPGSRKPDPELLRDAYPEL